MTTHVSSSRWQFSLRGLLVVTAAVGLWLLLATRVGWIEAGGVAIALLLAVVFVRLKGHREARVLRPFVGIVAGVVLWGVGVDWSVFRADCSVCRLHWYEGQARVFGLPIYRNKYPDHEDFFGLVASDLGIPCEHRLQRQQTVRLWGLVYPNPCINGICCLSGDEWYFEPQREQMRILGRERPALAQEFHARVILKQDYKYCRDFAIKFRTEHDPTYKPLPPPSNP